MLNIFVSYSHKDKIWLEMLKIHLKPIEFAGLISVWDDTKISPDELKEKSARRLDGFTTKKRAIK